MLARLNTHGARPVQDRTETAAAPAAKPTSGSTRLPTLFVSHGSPMFALEPGQTGAALRAWVARLPLRPRGIVLVSAHWMTRGPTVMTAAQPQTWHDFGGFPPELYALQYPAPGDPGLAQGVLQSLQAAGLNAHADPRRPFDHGAWVPLMHLFPAADVPVVQLSLPAVAAAGVYALGRALSDWAAHGVLLIGSGSMTHNLQDFFGGAGRADAPLPYVEAFRGYVEDAVRRVDVDALLHWDIRAPEAARAHPSDEHFLPLFFALGAAGWGAAPVDVEWLSHEIIGGALAMDALALQARAYERKPVSAR
jgi:4,5-DOPA dioxygenase extradiol